MKNSIKKEIKKGYSFAFAGEDASVIEAINNGNIAKTEKEAILGIIADMEGWDAFKKYVGLQNSEKIKLYFQAKNFEGWEQNHTHLYDLRKILNEI